MVYQVSKDTESQQNFPRLSVFQIEICLIIPRMKGQLSTMCVIMLIHWVPLSTMHLQALRFFRLCKFPPGLMNMDVSMTLAHSWDSGRLLRGRHLTPTCLGLETAGTELPVQLPALHEVPSLVCSLGIDVERLEWGQRGGSGG